MKLGEMMVEPEVSLELAPLIDVLFLIVLFYAVSSSLISPEDLASLQSDFATARTRGAALETTVEGQAARLAGLEADLGAMTARAATAAAEAERNRAGALSLRADLESANARAAARAAADAGRIEAQGVRLQQLDRDLAQRGEALAAQSERVARLDQELGGARAELDRTRADSAATLAARDGEIAALNSELSRLRIEIGALQSETDAYRKVKAEADERLAGVTEARKRLGESLKALIEDRSIGVEQVEDRLVLELSDRVLFDSGSDQLRTEGLPVLANVARVLAARGRQLMIQVGGHTDNVPLGGASRFANNWALSAARAVNVVRFLETTGGFEASRLSAVGYGEHQPIATNATPEGRAKNRRIEIVLLAN